jgi:hypothetical protein
LIGFRGMDNIQGCLETHHDRARVRRSLSPIGTVGYAVPQSADGLRCARPSCRGQSPAARKGRRNPSRCATPGTRSHRPQWCTLQGCRRALPRPFRPPEMRVARADPGFHPGLGSWRPFRPPEIGSHRVRNP